MISKKNLNNFLFLICLLIFIFSLNANYFDDIYAQTVSQEDITFYEIYPCQVSLVEFLIANPESIYQNHYRFVPYENSSIECFGRISDDFN